MLGIGRDTDATAIKSAYRKLARQVTPDVNKAPDAEERFKEVNEAYEVLSDTDKRQAYDRFGHAAAQGGFGKQPAGQAPASAAWAASAISSRTFSAASAVGTPAAGARRRSALRHGNHLPGGSLRGREREIEIPRLETCPVCQGSGAEPGTKPIRCPQCNGTGEVRSTTDDPGPVRQRHDMSALQRRA